MRGVLRTGKVADIASARESSANFGEIGREEIQAPYRRAHRQQALLFSPNQESRSQEFARRKKGSRKRGQQAIDSTRAREIQEALIREHYMQGEPSGTWDAATQAAMQRYQADQGWQSKTTPDSRALIKLGLGPSHDHLLNPESAMTMPSAPAAADPKPADPTPADPKSANPKAAAKQPPTDQNLPRR